MGARAAGAAKRGRLLATNYRIRALLYASKPNWALLDTLTPT